MKRGRTGQQHVETVIFWLLRNGRVWTTAEINAAVKDELPPTSLDSVRANERTSESKYDAIISNALEKGRGLSARGLIERIGDGQFRITASGLAELARVNESLNELFAEEDW